MCSSKTNSMLPKKSSRASTAQLETMLTFMEEHTLFARGQITALGGSGHDKYKSMWKKLTSALNNAGKCQKTEVGWETCWKHLKSTAKQKKAEYLFSRNQTGNNNVVPLDEFYERICQIFGHYGTGLSVIPEIGVPIIKLTTFSSKSEKSTMNTLNKKLQLLHEEKLRMMKGIEANLIFLFKTLGQVILKNRMSRNRSTKAQIALLISFMERNRQFSRNELHDIELVQQQWQELTANLNAIGGDERSMESWKRSWNDQVRLAKDKKGNLEIGVKTQPLTPTEKRILLALGENLPISCSSSTFSEPSCSFQKSQEPFKRSLAAYSEQNQAKKQKNDDTSGIMIMKESNSIVLELSTKLIETLQEQNQILKMGFQNTQASIAKVCTEISSLFDRPTIPPTNTDQQDHEDGVEEELQYQDVEYLEDERLYE